jgi:hypothetical protein
MKIFTILMLVAIVGSLFSALYYVFKDREGSGRALKALTVRVGLSVGLFLILMAVVYFNEIRK